MGKKYILSIDQSTQGTKALLLNNEGKLIHRCDLSHKQIINELGWVSHDPIEIYNNTINVVKNLVNETGISSDEIVGVGLSNQRETAVVWNRRTGEPVGHAIVWQCSRGKDICNRIEREGFGDLIKERTGIPISPYFPAAKIAWVLENVQGAKQKADKHELCYGTIDSWLIYKLTNGQSYRTDYSNASRTQLFNIVQLKWDQEICELFGINVDNLAEVCDSNAIFGETNFEGYLNNSIPIHSAMGDSHAALLGQGCLEEGMIKATYGTGSSIMLNVGKEPVFSKNGIISSLGWRINGKVQYVLEGNINYTGAVISWLKNDLKMLANAKESEELAKKANVKDRTYLVPAFTGLGAPYWDSKATGIICGITRLTGQKEIIKAALDSIVYQITDIIEVMEKDANIQIDELRVDGGPTKNQYLMQFQSDMLKKPVLVPSEEEMSGIGAAYAAGLALGIFDHKTLFKEINREFFVPKMTEEQRNQKYDGWKAAVKKALTK